MRFARSSLSPRSAAGLVAGVKTKGAAAAMVLALGLGLGGAGCKDAESAKPVGQCAEACEARAKRCSEHECHRGCTFVLDRLVENEGEHVLACVAASTDKCDDTLWANCAVRVGEHADGGPPPPPPPDDD